MEKSGPRVVIIGGGFGGLQAAKHLRNAPCQVTLIDKSNHHLFQPLLYQVATAGLSPGEIAAPIREVVGRSRNVEVLLGEVTGIEKGARTVTLDGGQTIPYDFLLIATGARQSYFGHNEWQQFAPGLKSIADATRIRRDILMSYEEAERTTDPAKRAALMTVVLVGAGPTGVEMAGSIAELARKSLKKDFKHIDPADTQVLLVEAGPRILSAFPESLAASAEDELKRLGVQVFTNTRVEEIDSDGVTMNGRRVLTHNVIWSAGVAASPASEWLGVKGDKAGRVPVGKYLQLEGHPEIFVIGDTALVLDENGKQLPGLAPVAMQQGRYFAHYIRATIEGKGVKPFHYVDKGSLATIGRAFAVADIGKLKLSGFLAWLIWIFVHIMYLVGFRNRVLVLIEWFSAYMTYERGVRLIVAD